MCKVITILFVSCLCSSVLSQPLEFSWDKRHTRIINGQDVSYNYISPAKDQGEAGPCRIFASVAAVEAMAQIYYNKSGYYLNLSESYIYSQGSGCYGFGCDEGAATTVESLGLFKSIGVIDDDCFSYPESGDFCRTDCQNICSTPRQRVFIPKFDSIEVSNASDLKRKLMDYGPIIMESTVPIAYALGHSSPNDICHTILVIGWRSSPTFQWRIKDSWQNEESIEWKTINLFEFNPMFFRVFAFDGSNPITCIGGTDCSLFSRSTPEDFDHDGFFNWGYDSLSKPSGASYPNFMDFDDGNADLIFRKGNYVLKTPFISSSPEPICLSGGRFVLDSVPSGFNVSWAITRNANCFDSPISGSGNTAIIHPNSSCIGIQSEITFTITNNGAATYKKNFYVNCPTTDQVSLSVLDSYGSTPPKYGDTYYLCPNTNYTIYYNNYDNCATWDFDWVMPYGWSENYHYNHYISINTNDNPTGFLEIWAKTDSLDEELVKVMNPYFGQAECGGYFRAFPNPSKTYVDVDIDKEKLKTESIDDDFKCSLSIVDRTGIKKLQAEIKTFPYRIDISSLSKGVYFINILYNGSKSSIRLIIDK